MGLPHDPALEHVSRPPLAHCVAPGVHAVVQVPALQVFAQGDPVGTQFPKSSQASGCWPLQRRSFFEHVPVQIPPLHT